MTPWTLGCIKRQENHTAEIEEAFSYADENGDNFVDRNEFLNFFSGQGYNLFILQLSFSVYDTDNNGKLDFPEFLEATKKMDFIRERGPDEPMYFGRVVFALSWIHEKIDTSGIFCARQ